MPLNTSGGNLAECCMHGLELVIEAVRQIRQHGDQSGRKPGTTRQDHHGRPDGDAGQFHHSRFRRRHYERRLSSGAGFRHRPAGRTASPRRAAGGHAAEQTSHPEMRRLRRMAVGAGMDLRIAAIRSISSWQEISGKGRISSLSALCCTIRCTRRSTATDPTSPCWWNCRDYGNIRMVGNLLGDPKQTVTIGAPVEAVFEPHDKADPPCTFVCTGERLESEPSKRVTLACASSWHRLVEPSAATRW